MSINLVSKKKKANDFGDEERDITEEDHQEKVDDIEAFRLKLKKFLSVSIPGRIYTVSLIFISILSSLEFIYQTYLDERDERDAERLNYLSSVEIALSSLFLADWLLMLFLADHKSEFFGSFFSMIDLLTIIPTIFMYNTVCPLPSELQYSTAFYPYFLYIMNAMATTRTLRILRLHRYLAVIEDPVNRCLANMALVIISMLIFDSCLMMFLERPDQSLQFQDWMYYTWVTICTVGYGDIYPVTTRGRYFFMCLIAFAVIMVPMLTNELFDILKSSSIYTRGAYRMRKMSNHVLVCGDLSSCSLLEFFEELFHEDHENLNLHAVILQPCPPTFEMMSILTDSLFSFSLTYLEGSPLIEKDLRRAVADKAVAVFLLTNKFSGDADEKDSNIILQQLSITRYSQLKSNGYAPVFCKQLIRPENRKHISTDDEGDDMVVCVNEIKMGMFAKAALFTGTNTLILNLISSFTANAGEEEELNEEKKKLEKEQKIDVLDNDNDAAEAWLTEYKHGCGWEIYTTDIAEIFRGAQFCQLSNMLYQKLGIILFGLQLTEVDGERRRRIVLNPGDYKLPVGEELYVEGLIIAENKATSDLSMDDTGGDINFARLQHLSLIANALKKFDMNKKSSPTKSGKEGAAADRDKRRRSFMFVNMNEIQKIDENLHSGDVVHDKQEAREVHEKYEWQRYCHANRPDDGDLAYEELHRVEEEYLKANYFLRKPMDLSAVTIKTSVMAEIPMINDHIIIIGKDLNNLYDLIRPLRAKYLGKLAFIVIFSPTLIPYAVWQKISIFEGVIFVRGSPLEAGDLRRAGIYRAQQVIVLANAAAIDELDQTGVHTKGANTTIEALADVDSIFIYQCVKKMNGRANIIIEIVHTGNVAYLDFDAVDSKSATLNYKFSPQFASGMLFTSSLLDTLICQAFYNPNIVRVVNKLIGGVDNKDATELKESKKRRKKEGIIKTAVQTMLEIPSSCIYQISIPENADNKTFGAIFRYLATQENIVPLGVLRGTFPHMKLGPQGNKMPYVVTNPDKDTEMFSCDKIFVLSQKPVTTMRMQAFLEMSNDIKVYEEAQRNKLKDKIQAELKGEFSMLRIQEKKLSDMLSVLETKANARLSDVSTTLQSAITAKKSLVRKQEARRMHFESSKPDSSISSRKGPSSRKGFIVAGPNPSGPSKPDANSSSIQPQAIGNKGNQQRALSADGGFQHRF